MSETLQEYQDVIKTLKKLQANTPTSLFRDQHIDYMCKNLTGLGKAIIYFDYGHPWIYFYILNSVTMMGK